MKNSKKVKDCSLSPVGLLPFKFWAGSCTASKEEVYLCFDNLLDNGEMMPPKNGSGDLKTCWKSSDAVSTWTKTEDSLYYHRSIKIATSDCKSNLDELKFMIYV